MKAIEAGARAIYERSETYPKYALRQMNDLLAADLAKACIEAAIASGELAPASAVAAERERCATLALEQICERGTPWALACTTIADLLRALSPEPASGEFVVVPRIPTDDMICSGDEEIIAALNDHGGVRRDPTPAHSCWTAMLHAATKDGERA